jgi:mono/diheme cytochrome c family protein
LTDEDVRNLVAFLRAWQPTAPDRRDIPPVGDLAKGKTLYANVCAVCHGDVGQGTGQAPALNDPSQLNQFDDAWYRDAITQGRPSKGMPTWGTVLSPQQVSDLIALLDSWRPKQPATPTPPTATPEGTASPEAP